MAGKTQSGQKSIKLIGGTYHIVGCSSPEYKCYPPFASRKCTPNQDCNYALSQLRWGLEQALSLTAELNFEARLKAMGVDRSWWSDLLSYKLAWYPYDDTTGTPP